MNSNVDLVVERRETYSVGEYRRLSSEAIRHPLQEMTRLFDLCSRAYLIEARSPSDSLYVHFLESSVERHLNIFNLLGITNGILGEIEEEVEDQEPADITLEKEVEFLFRALKAFNLKLADEDILKKVKQGDILEIYNAEGIQIYRSFSCFKYCTYSLVDLLVYSWDDLYARPSFVRNYLYSMVGDLMTKKKKSLVYDIPEYYIIEQRPNHHNKMMFKMEYATATLDAVTGEPAGLLTTGFAKNLVEPPNTIDFI